jgi:hypothetical protein
LPDCYFILSTNPRGLGAVYADVLKCARASKGVLERSHVYFDRDQKRLYVFIHYYDSSIVMSEFKKLERDLKKKTGRELMRSGVAGFDFRLTRHQA